MSDTETKSITSIKNIIGLLVHDTDNTNVVYKSKLKIIKRTKFISSTLSRKWI